jgi:hypothetical protein
MQSVQQAKLRSRNSAYVLLRAFGKEVGEVLMPKVEIADRRRRQCVAIRNLSVNHLHQSFSAFWRSSDASVGNFARDPG